MKSKKPRLVNVPQLVIPKDATPEEAARMAKEFRTRKTNQG